MRLSALYTIGLFPIFLAAQGTPPLTFEVASVKPAGTNLQAAVSSGPERFSCLRCSLFALVTQAYAIFSYQVQAPEWTRTAIFDVVAKMPAGSKREDLRPMLENLLMERFKMATHRVETERAVYELVAAKGGSKLETGHPAQAGPPTGPGFR